MALGIGIIRRHDLSISFLTPPVAWSAYFLILYPAASTVCDLASDGARPFGEDIVYASALALTAVVALAILASGFVNWRRLRQSRVDRSLEHVKEGDPKAFMAFVGLLMSVFFLVGTAFLALPMVMLGSPCR